jgi:cell division protein FtsB
MTAIGITLAIMVYVYLPAANRLSDMRSELRAAASEANSTTAEVVKLSAEKKALESDPLYLEKVIRTELRMVRPGEIH